MTPPAAPGRDDQPRGQILVMFALGLIVFLGFAALTVDIGFLLVTQRSYQNAADEAALAGATYLTRPLSDPCADIAGGGSKQDCARAAAWGFLNLDLGLNLTAAQITTLKASNTPAAGQLFTPSDGGSDYRLWVSTPPSGAGTSASMSTVVNQNQVLFVRVDRVRSPFIARVLGVGDLNVSSWATAGIFPNRFAVITLRRGQGSTEIDSGPSNTTDIKTAGTNSELRVVDGDVGGNWGMKLTSNSLLKLISTGSDDVNVYLIDYISCGNSCWSPGQIQDENGAAMSPKRLPSFVPDPNYAPPPIPGATWPAGLIDNAPGTPDIPNGDTDTTPYAGPAPSITINAGTVTAGGACVGPGGTAADAPRLGPGTYRDITVRNNACVILDPTWTYTDPQAGIPGGRTAVPSTQYPGIYYVTGTIDVRNSALIVGDGVTVIIRPTSAGAGASQYSPGSGGVMNLNTGRANNGTALKLGAWSTKAASTYAWNGSAWAYQASQEGNPQQYGVGIALYVLKPTQAGIAMGDGTEVIAVSSGAGLSWRGVTYAPNDNVQVAGQPNHDGFGQLISWTFTFNGGTVVTQTFDGPGDGYPYLIEPCVIVSGACQ
jgi:Flp pilus assembly protein TadG